MTVSLHHAPVGTGLTVSAVESHGWTPKVYAAGIREGATVTVIAREANGARLVRVGDARVSLAKQICTEITVDV